MVALKNKTKQNKKQTKNDAVRWYIFFSIVLYLLHSTNPSQWKALLISIAIKVKCLKKQKQGKKLLSSSRGSNSASLDPYPSTLPFELTDLLLL